MTIHKKNDSLSQELQKLVGGTGDKGLSIGEAIQKLDLDDSAKTEVKRAFKSLAKTGAVVRLDNDRFGPPSKDGVVEGVLRFERGRFVVATPDRLISIDPSQIGKAIGGDKVHVAIGQSHDETTHLGAVVSIAQQVPRTFYAIFRRNGKALVAEPTAIEEPIVLFDESAKEGGYHVKVSGRAENARGVTTTVPAHPLLVHRTNRNVGEEERESEEVAHEKDGERISADRAFSYVEKGQTHAATLIQQLARGMSVDIPFSPEAMEEAKAVDEPSEVDPDITDLTEEPLATIDGADAKDFDDAVAARKIGKDVELLVAIADVSAYVERGGTLDLQARERGSSVYLPGTVFPMLPEHLSNGVCSLVPNRLRRCAWVRMTFGPRAGLKEYDLGFGTMKSKARMTYEQVKDYLDGDQEAIPDHVHESVDALHEVFRRLHKKRKSRGMLDLDLGEASIQLSDDGETVQQVKPQPRWTSHRIIEECMLVTNETVADFLASKDLPCVYRSHDQPDDDRIEHAFRMVEELTGYEVPGGMRTIDQISEALDELQGHPLQRVASIALLKAMQKATYSVETHGHFGIGARRYAHFTSPIRRYADLEVHRVMRAAIDAPELIQPGRWTRQLEEGAKSANAGEFRAVQAERYAERLMKARYMLDHVGDEFDGLITGVTNFGVFVTIKDMPIEGLAHISGFKDDHYVYDEELELLKGRRSGKELKLGHDIHVKCRRVILHEGKVDFKPLTWG